MLLSIGGKQVLLRDNEASKPEIRISERVLRRSADLANSQYHPEYCGYKDEVETHSD
jgi:hypothetical protein